mmetsp:Transcript_14825/g.41968  ORF Transcript_14825/g.41968 Transcript_14825/m.41968 type:complete len:206 (+) Transcript_14825:88-705(+)
MRSSTSSPGLDQVLFEILWKSIFQGRSTGIVGRIHVRTTFGNQQTDHFEVSCAQACLMQSCSPSQSLCANVDVGNIPGCQQCLQKVEFPTHASCVHRRASVSVLDVWVGVATEYQRFHYRPIAISTSEIQWRFTRVVCRVGIDSWKLNEVLNQRGMIVPRCGMQRRIAFVVYNIWVATALLNQILDHVLVPVCNVHKCISAVDAC